MRAQTKVTVGLCIKNVEVTIKEAIDSVIIQNFPHELMELIVVDGYSEDKTLSIIKEKLLKMDIKSKIFYENRGLGLARQIVVNNAGGDYIVWVDGDMILSRDYVRKQVEFMEQNPSVGIAEGKYGMCSETNLVATLEKIERLAWDFTATSKPPVVGGSIYRVEAIRQVGGFDENIKGAGEDEDVASRIRAAGWLLGISQTIFYERSRETWKALWNEHFWYGYGGHYIFHKNKKIVSPTAFLTGLSLSFIGYKLTRRKVVFLLPIQYFFKKIAWLFGFAKGHKDGYGHEHNKLFV